MDVSWVGGWLVLVVCGWGIDSVWSYRRGLGLVKLGGRTVRGMPVTCG